LSLSARLSLLVAAIVSLVATSVAYLEVGALERNIESGLVEEAQLASQSAADDLAARDEPFDVADLRDALHDLLAADPAIDAMSILRRDDSGRMDVVVSTSTEERDEILELARRALADGSPQMSRTATVVMSARPVSRRVSYAAASTVGLEGLLQARARGLRTAAEFALPTIAIMTGLIYMLTRRVVGRPVHAILKTMDEASRGGRARTAMTRHDELGMIATGLDDMLDRLDAFNQTLQTRIAEATRDLSVRNAELAAHQSQLLLLRESLARAERAAALGQVAANVAHQAGTPLNLVSGYVQMIRGEPSTDARTRKRLQTVDTQIQQVVNVLRTFLDRARPAPGRQEVDLTDLVQRVHEIAAPRLAQSGIALTVSIATLLPRLHGDVVQLEMALLNLVTNALDVMPRGGTLAISAMPTPDGLRLEIADSGPGIAPEVLEHLFDPWVTTKPPGQGSGLGLAIVRDVVRAHGGTVAATNAPTGAVFTIELPATPVTETAEP
jgi:signal transduction histidine kinase